MPTTNMAQAQTTELDEVSVTATRDERATKKVPAAITVISEEKLETSRMFNITDAISGTPGVLSSSKNGGYDSRLIIRGAGLKANYGIREVMVLRDGVPITDPDSFTRMDFIDVEDIERVEITKGPGSLYAAGSAGGTIQIISKSVFDDVNNNVKLGLGDFGAKNLHLRQGWKAGDDHAFSITASHRQTDNDWRHWNEFDTSQISLKHGMLVGDEGMLETEIAYTEANLQLAGDVGEKGWQEYKETGEQKDTNSAFKHGGRYSDILFMNSRLELPYEKFTFKPRIYANQWSHYHPVTGQIVDTPDAKVFGGDLEVEIPNQIGGDSTLVAGITARRDQDDSERFQYGEVLTTPSGRVISTLSDQTGDLATTRETTNTIYGLFAQQTFKPNQQWLVDLGFRFDKARLEQESNSIMPYDYRSGTYLPGKGISYIDREFDLFSPRLGATYALNDTLNVFASISQADQVPYSSELDNNNDLKAARISNIELGLKGRGTKWTFDTSIYAAQGKDEVVNALEYGRTVYKNAGQTDKLGFEFAGSYEVATGIKLGLNYAYSDFTYDSFTEVSRGRVVDHAGNQMPYIPQHQFSVFADYRINNWTARLQAETWGEYYIDHSNTEKFGGYDLLTNAFLGYQRGDHRFGLNVANLFDDRYALEVKKGYDDNSYRPGAPRNVLATWRYTF